MPRLASFSITGNVAQAIPLAHWREAELLRVEAAAAVFAYSLGPHFDNVTCQCRTKFAPLAGDFPVVGRSKTPPVVAFLPLGGGRG